MTVAEHKAAAPQSVHCFIVTVSDTRTLDDDVSGRTIAELLTAAGHVVTGRTVVSDDPELVHSTIERHLADRGVQAIITNGGTGITSRDSTYEAISTLLEKRLDGFGELFRMLSYQEIGPAAMMTPRLRRPRRPPHRRGAARFAGGGTPRDGEAGDPRARTSRPAGIEIGPLMRPFTSTISLDEARRRLEAAVRPIARTEQVGIAGAAGRVVAADVRFADRRSRVRPLCHGRLRRRIR